MPESPNRVEWVFPIDERWDEDVFAWHVDCYTHTSRIEMHTPREAPRLLAIRKDALPVTILTAMIRACTEMEACEATLAGGNLRTGRQARSARSRGGRIGWSGLLRRSCWSRCSSVVD